MFAPRWLALVVALSVLAGSAGAQTLSRAEWGAPLVEVNVNGPRWSVTGKTNAFTLDRSDLTLRVRAKGVDWVHEASKLGDLQVRTNGRDFALRLADAREVLAARFDTGARTGLKLRLSNWGLADGSRAPLTIYLTLALEGAQEELVFDVTADESQTTVRQLDWPAALDAREVDYTVLNHYRGILLPRNWPEAYNPIRGDKEYPNDTSEIQSDVVECWSQSWWGFQKGPAAMMIIVQTTDDAGYQWKHPAGGPTVIGPRWRAQLGKLGYPRSGRMVFFDQGNYVTLAKRYRTYAIETGLWSPLTEKIARSPAVASLVGSIESRVSVLRNIVPESRLYDREHPERNHRVHAFTERAEQVRALKQSGIDRFNFVLTGWPRLGYDRQHPDVLPVAPESGGWAGMQALEQACREAGYLFTLHDQYRDYYVDAPSYDPSLAVQEEDAVNPPTLFPGTRFGSVKEGPLSFLTAWDGGKQTYLNAGFMLEHLKKNYAGLSTHGLHPNGSYLDVFGYVPPDQDFNPEHPLTRTEAKRQIATLYRWARANLGVVGTEAGCDWTVPYSDYSSALGPGPAGIPVPLFNLVYHDAVITPYEPSGGEERMNRDDRPNWLYGMLNGGMPRIAFESIAKTRPILDQITALHHRVALLEMTGHEFLDQNHQRERSTFSDGTTVTVDWSQKSVSVSPSQK